MFFFKDETLLTEVEVCINSFNFTGSINCHKKAVVTVNFMCRPDRARGAQTEHDLWVCPWGVSGREEHLNGRTQ